jgi:GST-like protein
MPYTPPKIWIWDAENGGKFGNINRPIAGPTFEKELPLGQHPLQLYSQGTPNGVKVTVMLEELLALGHEGAEYDAWLIPIGEGAQFGSGFVDLNPNSKIPAMLDQETGLRIFESGSILMYLAEKFGEFLPKDIAQRTETFELAILASRICPLLGRRFWSFLRLCARKIRIFHQSLLNGGKTPARRARPQPSRAAIFGWRQLYHRRYCDRAMVRRLG